MNPGAKHFLSGRPKEGSLPLGGKEGAQREACAMK